MSETPTFPVRWEPGEAHFKDPLDTADLQKKERRRDTAREAKREADKARKRDQQAVPKRRGCRMPHCPVCAEYRDLVPQAAHVFEAKGIGGDPTNERSTADLLMLLCPPIHAMQERGEIDVEPLSPLNADGPCAFYLVNDVYDSQTGRYSTERVLWDRETDVGVPEHQEPLVPFRRVRKLKEPD